MRYLMFSLTALFLLACGDTDNPVVPTTPAGKATVDLSAEECAAAESLPEGFLEQALAADPDIDAALLLTTWKAHGCVDWALWGLIWLASLDAEPTFEIEVYTPARTPNRLFAHRWRSATHRRSSDSPSADVSFWIPRGIEQGRSNVTNISI